MAEYHSVFMGSFVCVVLILLPLFTVPVHSQNCPVSGLGVEDTDVNSTTCEGFAGSVQIPAGRACYNGTTVGSIAEYACNCPSQYELDGDSTRVCQNDGTWTGTVPQCNPQCDSIPSPRNRFNHFVGPVDCSEDTPNVTATYSCGPYRSNRMIQFNTTDGDCQWPDPPCKVGTASLLTIGAGFYGSILVNIFVLVLGLMCYKPNKIFIPFVLVVTVILPPVGLIWAWWLVREKVPAVSPANKDKSFLRKWWRAILVIVGSILWLVCFATYIAAAAIFGPPDALPSQADYNLLIAGYSFMSFTFGYWIVVQQFLCQCGRPRNCNQKCDKQKEGAGWSKQEEGAEEF